MKGHDNLGLRMAVAAMASISIMPTGDEIRRQRFDAPSKSRTRRPKARPKSDAVEKRRAANKRARKQRNRA